MSTDNPNSVEFNGEVHEIPSHILSEVSETNPIESVRDTFLKGLESFYGKPEDKNSPPNDPPANDPPSGDPPSNDPPPNNDPPANDPIEPKLSWFKGEDFDYESEEEAREILKLGKSLKQKAEFINELESPFAEDRDLKVIQFKKVSGIMGRRGEELAEQIVLSDFEELKSNPLRAMAVGRAIDNTKMLSKWSIEDFEAKIQKEYELMGVDFEDTESKEYRLFAMDSEESLDKIEKYREKFGTVENPFALLQKNRELSNQQLSEKADKIKAEIRNFGNSKITRTIEGVEVTLEVPKDVSNLFPDQIIRNLANQFDVSTKEGKDAFDKTVKTYLLTNLLDSGDFEKAIWKKAEEHFGEEFAKQKHNGQRREIDRGAGKDGGETISSTQAMINQMWGL